MDPIKARTIALICLIAFALSAGLRLMEVQRWDPERHVLGGEHLLATHDAYAWVAGAEFEDARSADHPMSRTLATISAVTSVPSANLAFWLPAALGALAAVPTVLWAAYLGAAPSVMLVAGVLGSSAPAYFTRTRIGYFDTDWATLFFPLLISWLLACWLKGHLKGSNAVPLTRNPRGWIFIHPVLLCIVIPIGLEWHGFIRTSVLAMIWIALLLLIMMGSSTSRQRAMIELIAIALPVGMGRVGVIPGFALLFMLARNLHLPLNPKWAHRVLLPVILGFLLLFSALQFQDFFAARISHYLGLQTSGPASLTYPDPSSSVRENQVISFIETLRGIGFQWWVGALGLFGFLFILTRRPAAALLAPSLLLGLFSSAAGVRFAMFASPVIFLGLLLPLSWLAPQWITIRGREVVSSNTLFLGALFMLLPMIFQTYARLPVETILSPGHAAALRELDRVAESDGLVWTWWDYGYATQYFAGMPTFADGSRNSGPYLFVLGHVLGSEDLGSSEQLMSYTAAHDDRPWQEWEKWDAEKINVWLDDLHSPEPALPSRYPQYLVVQWEALSSLSWIQYYGSWNFVTVQGQSRPEIYHLQPKELDLESGTFTARGGQRFDLSSADLLDASEPKHYDYPQNEGGLHLLIHMQLSDVYILDDRAYHSTLVQLLLLEGPIGPESQFQLLVDISPDAKVYQIK